MSVKLNELGLGLRTDWITSASSMFRPETWPPALDWPVSIDRQGAILSRWSDPIWDYTPIAGVSFKLNFGDGPVCRTDRLDATNANILRLAITWRLYGPRPIFATATLQAVFTVLRLVISVCSRNGIAATELPRFPRVLDEIIKKIPSSVYDRTVAELHRLYDAREDIGFTILELNGFKRLAEARPNHNTIQTAYIPPRIWNYQINRFNECLQDFIINIPQIEACFHFCIESYTKNYGSLEAAFKKNKNSSFVPFTENCTRKPGCVYQGPFVQTTDRYRLTQLMEKWLGKRPLEVRSFAVYLNLVVTAGLAQIANFTMQRKEEVASLRADCLYWEEDEKFGRVPIICGETTKTDEDSDARWVASPTVERAILSLRTIAQLRMICDAAKPGVCPTKRDRENPYLFSKASEPWGSGKPTSYHIRTEIVSMGALITNYPSLLDPSEMKITSADLKIALLVTPNLPAEKFAVGEAWPLAWHQYRRTTAVNMFSSGLISDSSMQHQMKHCSRLMPLYYGRGYTRLHLNQQVESMVISAMYDAMATQLQTAMSDRFVSPYADQHKQSVLINTISLKDSKDLAVWAKQGKVAYRENRLGGCMKAGACEYGGVESISRCAGSEDGKPCSDALFDRYKEAKVRSDMIRVTVEMKLLPNDSPRHYHLSLELKAMENYLHVVA